VKHSNSHLVNLLSSFLVSEMKFLMLSLLCWPLLIFTTASTTSNSIPEVVARLENSFNLKETLHPDGFLPFTGCNVSLGPRFTPNIPVYTIDLGKSPEDRWKEVVLHHKSQLQNLIFSIKNNTMAFLGVKPFILIDKYLPMLARTLPKDYYKELLGIAKLLDIPLGEVTLFNVFYEFFSACTSIAMTSANLKQYLGRNLDFGLFLGWDVMNNTWLTTEFLRPLVVQLKFVDGEGTHLFSTVNFAGYIGVLTGVKPGEFALAVNERFVINGGYIGIIEWILGIHNQKWVGFLTRDVMTSKNYYEAQKQLTKARLVSPVYFTLVGSKPGQGCIITRGHTYSNIFEMGSHHSWQNETWFLVQTNYDHWKTPPFYDDRRTPAVTCLEQLGNINPVKTLFDVLSTKPVLNKLTTFTSIIDVNGPIQVAIQDCPDPCWPW